MLRLGAASDRTRDMVPDDIFLSRVQLMIIMVKAYLDGCHLGEQRRLAMLENARRVETASIEMGGLITSKRSCQSGAEKTAYDHLFYRRVKLLALMVKAAAKGFTISGCRKKTMKTNLNIICETLDFTCPQCDDPATRDVK